MKTKLLSTNGEAGKQIEVPEFFSAIVRTDLIQKIAEAKKKKQPYAPSPVAGNQAAASGKLKHHRHVWKSQYGRGMSRVPRKQMSRKGSQFDWVGATVPNTRGGRRAHPPKIISMIGEEKINKKELRLAIISALSATASAKFVARRYASIEKKDVEKLTLPLVAESKATELKIKDFLKFLEKTLGENVFSVAIQKKAVRKGRGKLRGRKHKKSQGLLFVVGEKEKFRTGAFEVASAKTLGINELAKNEPGRLTIYTENAIKELSDKFGGKK